MKKLLFTLSLTLCLALFLTSCSRQEITLHLSYGDKTGTYSGDMKDGIPHGQGTFTSENEEGIEWTYEGEFKEGHFDGEGKTTWKNGQIEIGTYKNDCILPLSGTDFEELYTTPKKYKNYYVEITGKVFSEPEYANDMVSVQLFVDFKNGTKNTIIRIPDDSFEIKQNDYLKISGKVEGEFKGVNAFGTELTVPTVIADEYEILSYKDAVFPTLKTIEVNQTKEQNGYYITVQKVEFAEQETRVYIKVENKGNAKFSVHSFNTKITQNGKQYQEQSNWEADYPKVQTDLIQGNSTEGIIAFPPLEQAPFDIIFDAYSDNYRENLNDFIFTISI